LADVSGIDPVLVQGFGHLRELRQQDVPVVVEVADQRGLDAGVEHPPLDLRHGLRRFRDVDRDPDHLRTGAGELDALLCRPRRVGGVGVRHRLDDDRRPAADLDRPDADSDGEMALPRFHAAFQSTRAEPSRRSALLSSSSSDASPPMSLTAGTRLGPYEILSRLGAGGMGEVWKARDTKLDRTVAVKVLPENVAADAEALARFEREAK